MPVLPGLLPRRPGQDNAIIANLMPACQSCGAKARPRDETCSFCGSDLFTPLTGPEVDELSKAFLTSLNESIEV